jgi:hypothetical protein
MTSAQKIRHSDILGQIPKTKFSGADLKTVLDLVSQLLVKVMRAERGFVRLFSEEALKPDHLLGITGLNADEPIRITESAYIQRLLAGRFVRDGSTLLVPLLCQSQTVGFCCLDRHSTEPFTEEDGHFIMGIGQAVMTLRDSHGAPRAVSDRTDASARV